MAELLQTVKRAAVDAVLAGQPVQLAVGRVEAAAPLRVRVEQKLVLAAEQLLVLEGLELKKGARVLLLRWQGGQRYALVGVVA